MWCGNCQADVAAEVSPVNGSVQCAVCGAQLAHAQGIEKKTRSAREILDRWSKTDLSDPFGPLPALKKPERIMDSKPARDAEKALDEANRIVEKADVEAGAEEFDKLAEATTRKPRPKSSKSKPKFRIDAPVANGIPAAETESRLRTKRPAKNLAFDDGHGRTVPPPHFEYTLRQPERQPNFGVVAGQWLAYLGVLGLTIGTAIVVYGHFGNYSNYTPTGWLVTTVGQMLLFLGVINLVSGGMEQSNDEVSQRIDMLGEHLLRLEKANSELRGPKIPISAYAGEDVESPHVHSDESILHE